MKSSLRLASLLIFAAGVTLHAQTPIGFVENRGQWPEEVRYRLQLDGLTMWITDRGAVYDLQERVAPAFAIPQFERFDAVEESSMPRRDEPARIRGHVLRAEFVGASESVEAIGVERMSGRFNYFIGDDETRWGRNCPLYASVRLEEVYEGIDVVYYLDEGTPRYDLLIAPGADPARVRMAIEGAEALRTAGGGRLVVGTSLGDVEMRELLSYQRDERGERCQVESRFRIEGSVVRFDLGAYDRSRPLVVDPLIYSTFLGGATIDITRDIAVDASGSVYVVGYTNRATGDPATFPTTPGAYDRTLLGTYDAFVTKLDPDGTSLIYSTFLGAQYATYGEGIAVDAEGYANVTGKTESSGFPTTEGAYNGSDRGREDVFVTQLTRDGSGLIFSTVFGGDGNESVSGIVVDGEGDLYIAGTSARVTPDSKNYPTTEGAYSRVNQGGPTSLGESPTDLVVTKLSADGTTLLYSTFIGSTNQDICGDIAVDDAGHAYVTGYLYPGTVAETGYPLTEGAYLTFYDGGLATFVTKLSVDGSTLLYSTLIGGSTRVQGIAVDRDGSAYVTGLSYTSSTTPVFPTTPGAILREPYNESVDVFVVKLKSDGSEALYSTLIAGWGDDEAYDIAVDRYGEAIVTGSADRTGDPALDFPANDTTSTITPWLRSDAMVTKLSADGSTIRHSIIIGGGENDVARALALDSAGIVYVTGRTDPSDVLFPTTEGSFQDTITGTNFDAFVAKLFLPSPVSAVEVREWVKWERIDLR